MRNQLTFNEAGQEMTIHMSKRCMWSHRRLEGMGMEALCGWGIDGARPTPKD